MLDSDQPAAALSPRRQREAARIARAVASARGAGASALSAALAEIGAAFDEAAAINDFKLRVERLLSLASNHPALRARFGARASMLAGCDLDGAVAKVERWWRAERKALQIACALGTGARLSLDMLSELRLILRWLRRKRMRRDYVAAVAALCCEPLAQAAE